MEYPESLIGKGHKVSPVVRKKMKGAQQSMCLQTCVSQRIESPLCPHTHIYLEDKAVSESILIKMLQHADGIERGNFYDIFKTCVLVCAQARVPPWYARRGQFSLSPCFCPGISLALATVPCEASLSQVLP